MGKFSLNDFSIAWEGFLEFFKTSFLKAKCYVIPFVRLLFRAVQILWAGLESQCSILKNLSFALLDCSSLPQSEASLVWRGWCHHNNSVL